MVPRPSLAISGTEKMLQSQPSDGIAYIGISFNFAAAYAGSEKKKRLLIDLNGRRKTEFVILNE